MRSIVRALAIASFGLSLQAAPALAVSVTPEDLVKLHVAGLSEEVLIALIEAEGVRFKLSADEIIQLRNQGLSERVLRAMLLGGRTIPVATAVRDSAPPTTIAVPASAKPGIAATKTAMPAVIASLRWPDTRKDRH